eukprot:TRINITY_DN5546_c0_g1_i1.p2 TRINITY_DN5546_c0_g1~~TRINITY_DN5546_c0_g1_i1.p2  ORF type:complete len:374 (-),score=97.77 TRINITY_DN5546_c0_g1_i1:78-1199(-)
MEKHTVPLSIEVLWCVFYQLLSLAHDDEIYGVLDTDFKGANVVIVRGWLKRCDHGGILFGQREVNLSKMSIPWTPDAAAPEVEARGVVDSRMHLYCIGWIIQCLIDFKRDERCDADKAAFAAKGDTPEGTLEFWSTYMMEKVPNGRPSLDTLMGMADDVLGQMLGGVNDRDYLLEQSAAIIDAACEAIRLDAPAAAAAKAAAEAAAAAAAAAAQPAPVPAAVVLAQQAAPVAVAPAQPAPIVAPAQPAPIVAPAQPAPVVAPAQPAAPGALEQPAVPVAPAQQAPVHHGPPADAAESHAIVPGAGQVDELVEHMGQLDLRPVEVCFRRTLEDISEISCESRSKSCVARGLVGTKHTTVNHCSDAFAAQTADAA